jgi:hypothetical protein
MLMLKTRRSSLEDKMMALKVMEACEDMHEVV